MGNQRHLDDHHEEVYSQRSSFEIVSATEEYQYRMEELKKKKKKKNRNKSDEDLDNAKRELVIDEHKRPLEDVVADLTTHSENGMTTDAAEERYRNEGPNILTPPKATPEWLKLLKEMTGLFALLLWAGSILSIVGYIIQKDENYLYLGIVLMFVVSASGVFSYIQNRKSSNLMESFKSMMPTMTTVIRNGKSQKIDATFLVRGDLIQLKGGDKVPADVLVVECSDDMQVDNASLTGESEPQKRTPEFTHENPLETRNLCFFGTFVPQGSCTALVINTGDQTVMGRIAKLAVTTDSKDTPIALEIKHFVHIISFVAIAIGIVFLVIGFVVEIEPITNIVFMLGIIVANVPEGLLVTVTVCLTLTANRMAQKSVLVKNLESVETLGSTTCICSDKTGTLTQNVMTVAHLMFDGAIFDAECSLTPTPTYDEKSPTFQALQRCSILCNNAVFDEESKYEKLVTGSGADIQVKQGKPIPFIQKVVMGDGSSMNKVMWKTIGDASESAFAKFAQSRLDIMNCRSRNLKIKEIPFNSRNKYQVSIHTQDNDDNKELLLVMKGAPERIISRCQHVLIEGEVVPLTEERKAIIEHSQLELSKKGMRVLGFCEKVLDKTQYPHDYSFNTDNPNFPLGETEMTDLSHPNSSESLCFLGLMALIDPPRPQVPPAVAKCKSAGIRVIMVTGDHPITAKSIAYEVGILWGKTKEDIQEYNELNKLSPGVPGWQDPNEAQAIVVPGWEISVDTPEEEWDRILSHSQVVFARTSPQQKLIIVENCQRRNEIVAVTGDGVNDSPALKKADIGIAMGIMGSEVSKEAADMILLDDNFASIVAGIEEGRLIFDNLKKSIAYTLSSNIPELAPFLLFVTIGVPLPLTTILILGIDLGTDMIPAISFAYEYPESDIMFRSPRDAKVDHLVTKKLFSFAYCQIGVIQALAGFFTWLVVLNDYGYPPSILPGLGRNDMWQKQVLWCKMEGGEYCSVGGGHRSNGKQVMFPTDSPCLPDYEMNATIAYRARVFWRKGANGKIVDCQYPINSFEGETSPPEGFNKYQPHTYGKYTGGHSQVTYQSMKLAWEQGYRPYYPMRSRFSSFFDYRWLHWDVTNGEVEGLGNSIESLFFTYQPIGVWGLTSNSKANGKLIATSGQFNAFGRKNVNLVTPGNTNVTETSTTVQMNPNDKYFNQADINYGNSTLCIGDSCLFDWRSGFSLLSNGKYLLNVASRMMQKEALHHSQTAYFISIVIVQWADLIICKTRWLSIHALGMRNSVMNFGLFFETLVCAFFCYVSGISAIGMRPIRLTHWFAALPFSIFIVVYDELRKYLMRHSSRVIVDKDTGRVTRIPGWLERNTYY